MTNTLKPAVHAAMVYDANVDAYAHQEEFPGETIQGDWDSEAFSIVCSDRGVPDEIREDCWEVYREELHKAVAKLISN